MGDEVDGAGCLGCGCLTFIFFAGMAAVLIACFYRAVVWILG